MMKVTSAAALVTNGCGEVLLIKSPLRGWEFPGGMVEVGETPEEALRREIFEETGVYAEIIAPAGVWRNVEKGSVHADFRCRYIDGKLTTSDESADVRWVQADSALEMVAHPLIRCRLENMLRQDGVMSLFEYKKEPFMIVEERMICDEK